MKRTLNADWALNLPKMRLTWADVDEEAIEKKIALMAEYVKKESDGSFLLDKNSGYIIQKKNLPWSCVFDVIKNAGRIRFVVLMSLPPRFRIRTPAPAKGKMYAYYNSAKDAVRLLTYTGKRREDLAGYDGYGRGPDETEVVEGLRDRNGNWIKELDRRWK